MIYDTHAHYDDKAFDEDREKLLNSMSENGIKKIINASADIKGCSETLKLCEKYPFIYGMLGVHPSELEELSEADMQFIKGNCSNPKILAIGEIGLDYHYEDTDKEVQKKWFIRQLELAREVKLPVNIHSRDAAKDTMDIMKEMHAEDLGGIIHCYSYSKEMALEYVAMGFSIGVGGVVTFKNAKKLKETVEAIPMENIVLETDCPYLAPTPFRGERNSSLYLPYVVKEIALIKGLSEAEVEEITFKNAERIFYR